MTTFLKKNLLVIVAGLLAFACAMVVIATSSERGTQIQNNAAKIAKLEADLHVRKQAMENNRIGVDNELTGLDASRKERDDKVAADLMSTASTWDSFAAYSQARQDVMRRFSLAEDSLFMKSYMPPAKEQTSSDGTKVNQIDQLGQNMSFVSMTTQVARIDATNYEYFALVTTRSSSADGKAAATGHTALTYTVDGSGTISKVVPMPVPEDPATAG